MKRTQPHAARPLAGRGYVLLIVMVIGVAASLAALSIASTRGGAQLAAIHTDLADRSQMIAEAGMARAIFYVNDVLGNQNDFDQILDTDLDTDSQSCGSDDDYGDFDDLPTSCSTSGAGADLRPDTTLDGDDLQEWTDGTCEMINGRTYTCVPLSGGRYCVRFEDDDDDGVETDLWSRNTSNNVLPGGGCGTGSNGCREGNPNSASVCSNDNGGRRNGYRDRNRAIWVISIGIYPDVPFADARHKTTLRRYHMAPRFPSSAGIKIKGNLDVSGGSEWLACSDLAGVEIDGTVSLSGGGTRCVSGRSEADAWSTMEHCYDLHQSGSKVCEHLGSAKYMKELHLHGDANGGNRIPAEGLPLNTPGPTLPDLPDVWNNANQWVDWDRPCVFWIDTGDPGGGMGLAGGDDVLWYWDAEAMRGPGGTRCGNWEDDSAIDSAFPGPPNPSVAWPRTGANPSACSAGDTTPSCWAGCWTPLLFADGGSPPNYVTLVDTQTNGNEVYPHAWLGDGVSPTSTSNPGLPIPEGTNYDTGNLECFSPAWREFDPTWAGGAHTIAGRMNVPPSGTWELNIERPVNTTATCTWMPTTTWGFYETCDPAGDPTNCFYFGYGGGLGTGVANTATAVDPVNARLSSMGLPTFPAHATLLKPDWNSACTIDYPPVAAGAGQQTFSSQITDSDGGNCSVLDPDYLFTTCCDNACTRSGDNTAMNAPENGGINYLWIQPQDNAEVQSIPAGVYFYSNGFSDTGSAYAWGLGDVKHPHDSIGKISQPAGDDLVNSNESWPLMTLMSTQTMLHQFGSSYRYGIGQTHPGARHGGEDADFGVNATWITGGQLVFQGSAGDVGAAGGVYAINGADWSGSTDYYVYGPLYTNSSFSIGGSANFYWIYQLRFDQPPTGGYGGVNPSQSPIVQ